MKDVLLYDTTLRDGCQAEDVSLTLEDKLRMAAKLDDMGIDYIEGGYPGSNPRDADFFKQVKSSSSRMPRSHPSGRRENSVPSRRRISISRLSSAPMRRR